MGTDTHRSRRIPAHPNDGKYRSRRLQKKLRLGPFQQNGFEVSFQFREGLSEAQSDKFWTEFIIDYIEYNGLSYGGGNTAGFITLRGRGTATETHRQHIRAWLAAQIELSAFTVGELVDAYYA